MGAPPHKCHRHLQNEIQLKNILVSNAVDQERLTRIRRTHLRYDEFIGQVQHRAQLGSHAEAERATRATLETLAERLVGG